MIIKPKVRGFVCVTAHPEGCAAHVQEWIDYVKAQPSIQGGPKKVLVIGSSTGYGLASRLSLAFGARAATLGVFFERPSEEGRPATPGWYNTIAFTKAARADGLYARNIMGDAFSDEIKAQTIDAIKADLGQVDLVVYSLASPRRTHPKTGAVHKSCLKPLGAPYTNKTVDTDKGIVSSITIEPADEAEVADTVAVMGGEDWELWIDALRAAGVLAPGAQSLAYSYIGPEVTWPIYQNGTIGMAKNDLSRAAKAIDAKLSPSGGRAFISVNKALVTQASSAIPVVPLYISILYKVMKAAGLHEGCIEQMHRLFATQVYNGHTPTFDEAGRVRIDDLEMRPEIQAAVAALWPTITTENLESETDIAGYRTEFLKLFGFGLNGVNYDAETEPHIPLI
ncbi:trans-2-enoyl-CoA reductase [Cephaloticoccus capnophilus]|uniref:Enoyl-[acyl-carrier-protein] reductase [NADH] n=1 Tax=Cephaloticoccus capnophilus TaxID=1548208 RepID=A0A139SI75_9BACT|nr:enoyl-ACP reductase FabV [Cephaloticoccus capnophilus]KXU34180.1 trans-2-enoyl-CoA reductase [Cephaloticoccus capnophilus]